MLASWVASRQVTAYYLAMNEFLTLFTRASKLMRGAVDEAMSRHGVRVGQNLVLEVLWQGDGLTPGELASRLQVATPTVVKSANRMSAAGLVVRGHRTRTTRGSSGCTSPTGPGPCAGPSSGNGRSWPSTPWPP